MPHDASTMATVMLETTLSFLPLDLLGFLTSFLPAVDVINLKFVCRVLRSKMERGGLGSYKIENYDGAPKSPTWLSPVIHSRLVELIVTCSSKPTLQAGIFSTLPSSLKRIGLDFECAMSFLEPLPLAPGVTKSLQESYSMMKLDTYFPNLTHLSLVDHGLSWNLVETEPPFLPTSGDLQKFVCHLPPSLLHLKLEPFPSLNGKICNLPPLTSFDMHCSSKTHHFELPPSLTALGIIANMFVPELDYSTLLNLEHLSFHIPFMHSPPLPATLQSLKFVQGSFLNARVFPEGLVELDLGDHGTVGDLFSRLPPTVLKLALTSNLTHEDLASLPRSLTWLRCGCPPAAPGLTSSSTGFRLGLSDDALSSLPRHLVRLTIEGRTRFTHACWMHLPSTLCFLSLPGTTVRTSFVKILPPNICEVHIGILQFTFKEAMALVEETPACIEVPKTLERILLSKIVPKRVIFCICQRSECDLSDQSAKLLPRDLRALAVIGSQVGITDEFVRLLPPELRTLRMPHQLTFTSRVISLLPKSLTTLELDGYGLPDNIALPPHITSATFSSTSTSYSRKLFTKKAPK